MCNAKSGTLNGMDWKHMVIKHLPQSAVPTGRGGKPSADITKYDITLFDSNTDETLESNQTSNKQC